MKRLGLLSSGLLAAASLIAHMGPPVEARSLSPKTHGKPVYRFAPKGRKKNKSAKPIIKGVRP